MSGPVDTTHGAAALMSARMRRTGAPSTVLIQVTDRCNYACVHCYETHEGKDELSFVELDRVIGEIAAEGTMFLTLTGGEFFMRRDADDILRSARRRRFAVKLLTTGHFIDERRADLIRDLGAIQVEMSFYSADPAIHDHVTQMPQSWKRTLRAAKLLRERRVTVVLKSPVMSVNIAGMPALADLARELDCGYMFDPMVTGREDGDKGPTELRAGVEALRAFYSEPGSGAIQQIIASYGGGAPDKPLDETPCRAGHDIAAINVRGEVLACHSLVNHPLGDLKKQSFHEIWRTSPVLKRIRGLTWGTIEECNRCDVRAYCSRCHAMAELEEGKLNGPSREACRHAVIIRNLLREKGLIPAGEDTLPPPLVREAEARSRLRPAALRVVG